MESPFFDIEDSQNVEDEVRPQEFYLRLIEG